MVPLRLEMGRLAFIAKRYEDSARQFEKVRDALADESSGLDAATRKAILAKPELTYQLFGESFLESGGLAAARAAFEKANEAKPDEGLYAYNLARVLAKENQPAQALARRDNSTALSAKFKVLAKTLADNEAKIDAELIAAQGKPVNTGGYYLPDQAKTSAAMRPSPTLNDALDKL